MRQLEVQIVELPAMRVASALGFGTEPEMQASGIINEFAKKAGIELDFTTVRMYGFDNPTPSPGSPNYGYEFWLPVDESVQGIAPVEIKHFAGGTFATTRFTGLSNIGRVWKELAAWVEESPYSFGSQYGHGLEKNDTPFEQDPEKWTFDLYIPVSGV
ncbi:GyrI-like domain-containing protein [Candidatus Bipolaricaulota bacterium]|nr:GyrI-like domain-containing protein [Candidatus Bipolaricaulota bacterium]